jgi:2-keto-3-deoxy-L-rhamnonate aldolase RhmA
MQEGINTILGACETHGKTAACLAGSVETGIEWVTRGFRMISYSYDIGLMTSALQTGIDEIRAGVTENGSD